MRELLKLVGQDRSLVVGCLRTLEGAINPKTAVTAQDITMYGGEPGSATPWDMDDAIDNGDVKTALEVLHRQLLSRSVFQIIAMLHTRYQRMLRLDGARVANAKDAAKILDMKGSSFPAQKLLVQTRRLGSQKIARSIQLLAEADLHLKGAIDWPPELIAEVLVARLASISKFK